MLRNNNWSVDIPHNVMENGSFKVAFWTMTVITTVFMAGIVSAVVANDRLRAVGDDGIDQRRIASEAIIKSDLNSFEKDVISRLARIEVLIVKGK